jgi:RND family efflux transporter MFP subunit
MEKPVSDLQASKTAMKIGENRTPKKKSRIKSLIPWSVTLLIAAGIILVIVYASSREKPKPAAPAKKLTNVEVETIHTEEFIESLTLPAIISADRVAQIRPELTGILERWFVAEGEQVQMGDVIAEIDTLNLRLKLKELEAAFRTAIKNVAVSNIRKENAEVNLANIQKHMKLQEIALESAQAKLKLVQKQFDRHQKLAKQNIVTASKLDDVQNTLTQAELGVFRAKQNLNNEQFNIRSAELTIKEATAGIELAEARIVELEASIALLEYQIEKGRFKAPFSGRLDEHLVQSGEMVSPSAPIVNIYDLRYLRAVLNVPDRVVAFIDAENKGVKLFIKMNMPGAMQRIKASLIIPGLPKLTGGTEAGIELDADIARIAQSSDPESNTFKVELRLPNPGNALKHGMIVRSKLEFLYYPDAILIPVKAVQVTDTGPRVLVLNEENGTQIVNIRDINPISIQGSKIFIRGGLKQGDRLVIAGWKGLVGGEKVNVLVEDGNFIKLDSETKE